MYSVIIFRVKAEDNHDDGVEVKRFRERSFERAKSLFNHHLNQLSWSRQHKENMGLSPKDSGKVQLFDHDCGYELEERSF